MTAPYTAAALRPGWPYYRATGEERKVVERVGDGFWRPGFGWQRADAKKGFLPRGTRSRASYFLSHLPLFRFADDWRRKRPWAPAITWGGCWLLRRSVLERYNCGLHIFCCSVFDRIMPAGDNSLRLRISVCAKRVCPKPTFHSPK
jgi:hypothetical protein